MECEVKKIIEARKNYPDEFLLSSRNKYEKLFRIAAKGVENLGNCKWIHFPWISIVLATRNWLIAQNKLVLYSRN